MKAVKIISVMAVLMTCGVAAAAAPERPERIVRGTVISSQHSPPVHIQVPDSALYVGADRWVLYDVADCEIHVFVEADAQKKIKRIFWIQFEAYIPAKPDSRYDYSGATMNLDGTDFFVRARFGPTSDTGRPGSDSEHVQNLLRDHGYTAPAEMMNVRLVHLPDEMKRKELMIIYAEDLEPIGLTSAQLIKDGKPVEQWAVIEKDLIERARKSITLRKMD